MTALDSIPTNLLNSLEGYIEAISDLYLPCLSHIEHDLEIDSLMESKLRLHHLKFDGNGLPETEKLVLALADHIIYFCVASTNNPAQLSHAESSRLYRKARDLFRQVKTSGDLGELLLYFLLEVVLKAPQMVCKMDLKTNSGDEVKGADGIHMNWVKETDCLNVYLGEAKLYQSYGSAIDDAIDSVSTLHKKGKVRRELDLVTAHFKHADEALKKRIIEYLDGKSVGQVKLHHACLIGFDWASYKKLEGEGKSDFISNFESHYLKQAQKLAKKIEDNFKRIRVYPFSVRNLLYPLCLGSRFPRQIQFGVAWNPRGEWIV